MSLTTIPDLERWVAEQLGIPIKNLGDGTVRYFVEKEKMTPAQIVTALRGNRHWCAECSRHLEHDEQCSRKDFHSV